MKTYSHIPWILVSLALVSCSGSRTAGTLEIKDKLQAETQLEVRDIVVGEKYRFSPTKDWRGSFDPKVYEQEVTVTLSNQSSVAVTYPDPVWVRTDENYVEPWVTLPPQGSDVLHKGALGEFSIRLKTKLKGTQADVKMTVRFDNPVNSIKRFYLTATWSDGP